MTVTSKRPGSVPAGTATRIVVERPPKPYTLVGLNVAEKPLGMSVAEKRIRSNEVDVRVKVIGTRAIAPASADTGLVPARMPKSPRRPSLDTLSSFSCTESGSVQSFQSVVPRYWSASLTSAGVSAGRVSLSRAAAPVTCGAAIDVPDMYWYPPG